MGWKTVTLGSICGEYGVSFRLGPFGSQLHESDYSEDGIPVVMPKILLRGVLIQLILPE